jgi:hypothetical protein
VLQVLNPAKAIYSSRLITVVPFSTQMRGPKKSSILPLNTWKLYVTVTFTQSLNDVVSMVMLLLANFKRAATRTVSILAVVSSGPGFEALTKSLAPSREALLRILEVIIALPNSVIPNTTNSKMGSTMANSIMVSPF